MASPGLGGYIFTEGLVLLDHHKAYLPAGLLPAGGLGSGLEQCHSLRHLRGSAPGGRAAAYILGGAHRPSADHLRTVIGENLSPSLAHPGHRGGIGRGRIRA